MWKKITAALLAFGLLFGTAAPAMDIADAKPRYRSPSKSFTPSPAKPRDNVTNSPQQSNRVNDGTTARPGTAAGTRPSFGGSLMRGMMIGGLAGLLFGGLFGGLGFLGNILGLAVNLIAIYVLFLLVRGVFRYFTNKNRYDRRPYR
jgi:predicted lipid-binding transport protein (Tim44 family)